MPGKMIKPKNTNTIFSKSFVLALTIVILFSVGAFYILNAKPVSPASGPDKTKDSQVLAQLKTIILLPEDINPTIAIINDADILRSKQPAFFANAKDGDRLIIYPDLAIIYDYEANKIIKVGPVENAPVQNVLPQNQ
jgi:hypothetical protein